MESSACYERLGFFDKAIDTLHEHDMFDMAIDTLRRWTMQKKVCTYLLLTPKTNI